VEGTITRRYEPADAAAVAELVNLVTRHAGGHPGAAVEELAAYLATTVRDLGADTRLVLNADGELVAAAAVISPPDGGTLVDLFGGVHPRWRGRGLGRELVRWQLSRAAEIHRAVAPDRAWDVQLDVVTGDEDAVRLLERFGLTPARYWFEMVAPAGPVAALVPDGLRVEPYTAARERDLHAVHMGVFAGHWGFQHRPFDRWAPMTVRSELFRPDLSVLAFDGDQIVGYVLSYGDADPDRIYIGQVGVESRWRRRGVAGGLLAWVLRAAGEAGKRRAGLAVDAGSPVGAVGVYERVGFTVESRAVTYSAPLAG
jgi:ribosomal protein S18 acetylase RimI-like enzyme